MLFEENILNVVKGEYREHPSLEEAKSVVKEFIPSCKFSNNDKEDQGQLMMHLQFNKNQSI
jgi:hypothetical protein